MLKKGLYLISSRNFAIYCMLFMFCLLIIGAILPSPSSLPQEKAAGFITEHPYLFEFAKRFNVQRITSSWFFLVIPLFLFISISACTFKRIQIKLKSSEEIVLSKGVSRNTIEEVVLSKEVSRNTIKDALIKNGWWIKHKENEIVALKGRIGFWGSVVFHAGMLLLFAGIGLSVLTGLRSSVMLLQNRETAVELQNMALIYKKPLIIPDLPDVRLTLKDFFVRYRQDKTPDEYRAVLLFEDEEHNVSEKAIAINQPLKYKGIQFTLQRYGITPRITINDPSGQLLFDGDVNLVAVTDAYDMFQVAEEGLVVYTRFYPDMMVQGGMPVLKGLNTGKPGFEFIIKNRDGKETRGYGYLNSSVRVGDYNVSVRDLKYWVQFDLTLDYGLGVIIAGIIVILFGLVIRFIDYDRYVYVKICNDKVLLTGQVRFFKEIFKEELKGLKTSIEGIK